ncbi:MAG: trimeric intracellular cation channel family protein [Nitrososphaeraceae archaeon]
MYTMDLFGTMAFAVTGAFKAIENKLDIVGVIVLASTTGLAGGLIRDTILDRIPPNIIADPFYLITAVSTGIIIFFIYPYIKKHWNLFLKFDAIGLGVFSIIGASLAYSIFDHNYIAMIIAGMSTAIGGGVIRDLIVKEVPLVFRKELYATASFTGISIFFIMLYFNMDFNLSIIISIIIITVFRLLSIKFNWNLPISKT